MLVRLQKLSALLLIASLLISPGVAQATGGAAGQITSSGSPPDVAQPLSFDPNSLNGLGNADPASNLSLIGAPEANNMGAAQLSYPITVPPGRQGMQPNLALNYGSGSGNGWAGLGWSLSNQAIEIDTRWGVPRYDPANETETYLLNGSQLTPRAFTDGLVARNDSGDKTFRMRIESNFDRVIRHGNSPADYWWEVTDQNGTHFYFGATSTSNGPIPEATLTDADGNIFKWVLAEVVDISLNSVRYSYEKVEAAAVSDGAVMGSQLYLQNINYTGSHLTSPGTPGKYDVVFTRETGRADVIVSARGGFLIVTAERLKQIEVTYQGQTVRSYDLTYETGPFEKSLLTAITEYGSDGSEFGGHSFSYYDTVSTQSSDTYNGFRSSPNWDTKNDDVELDRLFDGNDASALSGSTTSSGGAHAYIGFAPLNPGKELSGGAAGGFDVSNSESILEMLDINGDDLPDKVFEEGGTIYYRLNQSGPDGGAEFGDKVEVTTLGTLSKENSSSGWIGPEAYFGANVVYHHTWITTEGTVYFSDVNQDGLIDLVDNGQIKFNHLENGHPVFTADSGDTSVPIADGELDIEGLFTGWLEEKKERYAQQIENFPLQDTLRRWVAPYSGDVTITGDVALVEDTSPDRASYLTADGVRVAIQHNANELWSATIEADDYASKTPTGVESISVQKGDAIYFRVQSRYDGRYDEVAWDPRIEYLNVPSLTDVNGLDPYAFQAADEFTLAGRRNVGLTAPVDGTVNVGGVLTKSARTTDDLTVQIFRVPKDDDPEDEELPEPVLVDSTPIAWNDTGPIAISVADIQVNEGDQIRLHVNVGSRIDLSQIQWIPQIFYTFIEPEEPGDPPPPVTDPDGRRLVEFHPPYSMDTYPTSSLNAPLQPWTAPDGATELSASASFIVDAGDAAGEVTLTAKRAVPSDPDDDSAPALGTASVMVEAGTMFSVYSMSTDLEDVHDGDQIYFEVTVEDPDLAALIHTVSVDVHFTDSQSEPMSESVPSALYTTTPPGYFGQAYRGWSYAGYNGDGDRATNLINEADLIFEREDFPDGEEDAPPENPDDFDWDNFDSFDNTLQSEAYPYYPSPQDNAWKGPDELMSAHAGGLESSRIGPDYIPEPTLDSFDLGGGARGVIRESDGDQDAIGVGALVIGTSFASGSSDAHVDFLDMNGDGFPDIVTDGAVQYTNPLGGLESSSTGLTEISTVRTSHSCARVVGISGDVAEFKQGSTGKANAPQAAQSTSGGGNNSGKGVSSGSKQSGSSSSNTQPKENSAKLSFSASFSANVSHTNHQHEPGCDIDPTTPNPIVTDLADINGDGLPDRVLTNDDAELLVAFNLGYGFTDYVEWGEATIDKGTNDAISFGVGLGFSYGPYAFAGGVSFTMSDSEAEEAFVDINGDGLADHVTTDDDGKLYVAFNTGNGFAPRTLWDGSLGKGIANSTSTGQGGGATFTIAIGPLCKFGCYIIINPGVEGSDSMSRQELMLRDINGDGYPDDLFSTEDSQVEVALNNTDRTNLLKSVSNPLGGTMELEYERDGNTLDQPNSLWVLSKVTVDDGVHATDDGADQWVTTYQYEDNIYNYLEREFFGYARVLEEQRNPADDSVYRTIVREYLNENFYNKGLLTREYTLDASGNRYRETVNHYRLWDVIANTELADPQSTSATVFPQLVKIERLYYEGGATAQKTTFTEYQYDELGNVTRLFDAGEPDTDADDLIVTVGFPDTCLDTYVFDVPTEIDIRDSDSNVLRHREQTVPCNLGVPSEIRQQAGNGQLATTNLTYFDNGNLKEIVWPENQNGERYTLAYEYDSEVETHVASLADSFGYVSTATHNLLYGSLATETDINGNQTSYTYDQFGRLTSVTGPRQQGGTATTASFAYHLPGPDTAVAWSEANHIDEFNPGDTIDTAQFVDGLGRVIQTKREADIFTATDSAVQHGVIVSGWQVFDFLGRITEQYHPVTEPLGQMGTFNQDHDDIDPDRVTYDVLDRITRAVHPSGTVDTYSFGIDEDRDGRTMFHTRWTDALEHDRDYFSNVRRKQTAVRMFLVDDDPNQAIWTSYGYNPMGELVSIADPEGNVTSMAYDALGRNTAVDNPNAGLTELVYDPASNVVAKITANLRADGQQINYDYEFNRLQAISYPDFPDNNVSYSYGGPGAADNRAGRITQVTYEAGSQERFYGPLGEVVKQIDTVNVRTGPGPDVYTTEFSYDTWGRLGSMIYPDGEVLTYTYDHGGNVNGASGEKTGHTYPYVDQLEYDKHDNQKYLVLGNGDTTLYTYAPTYLGLTNQQAMAETKPLQDIEYSYDNVGNLTLARNSIPVPPPSEYGGPSEQTYTYDDLNRLIGSHGEFRFNPNKMSKYDLSLSYDVLGNITSKQQQGDLVEPSDTEVKLKKISRNWAYDYDGPQPNAMTHIGQQQGNGGGDGPPENKTYTYDLNGNQTGWTHDRTSQFRTIVWDEENRMQTLADNTHTFTYDYNDVGQRILETGIEGETAYVNPYFTVNNGTLEMKHVFVGSRRIAAQRVMDDGVFEHFQYFFHLDRQGSTNWVVDEAGEPYRHLEYFPTGESWVDQRTNQWRNQHLYTGQKWDEQMSLYYYGARYYDPQVGQFLSSDPLFMNQPGLALDEPMFLNTYAYVNNNPATLVDPSGAVDQLPSSSPEDRGVRSRITRTTSEPLIRTRSTTSSPVARARSLSVGSQSTGGRITRPSASGPGKFTRTHGITHAEFVKLVEEEIYPQYRPKLSQLGSEENPPNKWAVRLFLLNKRGIGKQIWKAITYSPTLVSFEFSRSKVTFTALGLDTFSDKLKVSFNRSGTPSVRRSSR